VSVWKNERGGLVVEFPVYFRLSMPSRLVELNGHGFFALYFVQWWNFQWRDWGDVKCNLLESVPYRHFLSSWL